MNPEKPGNLPQPEAWPVLKRALLETLSGIPDDAVLDVRLGEVCPPMESVRLDADGTAIATRRLGPVSFLTFSVAWKNP